MTFCTNYSKSSYGFTMGAAINLKNGGGHTKVDCHANYANCEIFAVLIPFQISILSAVKSLSKSDWYFSRKCQKFGILWPAAIRLHTTICVDIWGEI